MQVEKTTIIDGRSYSFGFVPPTRSIIVQVAISKVIGEPLFKALVENTDVNTADKKAIAARVAQSGAAVIGLMTSRMDAAEIVACMKTVFEFASCDGERINIESTFIGRPREMWQAFFYGLKVNFADFLPESLFNLLGEVKIGA